MKQRERVAVILVDGSNAYAASRALGFSIDYKKVLDTFEGTVLKAFYFTALRDEQHFTNIRTLVDWLGYNGWHTITKPTQEWTQADGTVKIKGNLDIEICTIAYEMAPYITDLILFSGDGDFTFMVEALQRGKGINVTVVSTIKTAPAMCADVLRRQADAFWDLSDLKATIGRSEEVVRSRRFTEGK